MREPKRVNFKPRWPVVLSPAAEASLAETPFTGSLPTEAPRIDTRIVPREGWYGVSFRSLSEITDLTQRLADYAGYDVIFGHNPDFSDLRSLSSEVSQFTKLTSEPFAEGSFIIPASLDSDPFTVTEPVDSELISVEKRQLETDAIAHRFGEILSYVDKDRAPTNVSIGALQTLVALKRTLNREASVIEFSTVDRFSKPLIRFSIERSFIAKVEQAIGRRRPSQDQLETIEGRVTALDIVEGRLYLSMKEQSKRVRGKFSPMLNPSILDSLDRRVKLQGVVERQRGRPHLIHIDSVEMLDTD